MPGQLFISDQALNLIRKISGGALTTFPVTPALSFRSWQIAVDSAGHVYGEDASLTQILVLTQTGDATPPTISVDSVTNGASNLQLPIAPGEIVILTGSGLGPVQLVSAHTRSDGFYDTQLARHSQRSVQRNSRARYPYTCNLSCRGSARGKGASVQLATTDAPQTAPRTHSGPRCFGSYIVHGDPPGSRAAAVNQNGLDQQCINTGPDR